MFMFLPPFGKQQNNLCRGDLFFLENILTWTEKPSQFQRRPFFFFFFLENTLIWTEKPSQFQWRPFFFRDYHYLDRKPIDFFLQNLMHQVIFRTKVWCPPQIILSSYAHDNHCHVFCSITVVRGAFKK